MIRPTLALALAALSGSLLAGCAGSRAVLPALGSAASISRPSALQQVTFHIAIPQKIVKTSHGRRLEYVSAATQSVTISEQPAGGAAISATSNCTVSACDIALAAPIGTGAFTISLFDAPGGGGHLLSSGTKTVTIKPNVVNVVGVTFNPVVASIVVNVDPTALAIGTPTLTSVAVIAKDPAGNTIIGPGSFPAPITISTSDASGAITLPKNTIVDVDQALEVDYNGATIANPTFTASMPGLASSSATVGSLMLFNNLQQIGNDFTGYNPDSAAALDSVPMDESAPGLPLGTKSYGQPGGAKSLPAKVDLSPLMPPPGDQGAQGSCTGWSAAYGVMTYQEKVLHNWSYYLSDGVTLDTTHLMSPAFLYNQVHLDNSADGGGATLLANLALLSTKGVAALSDMPYNPTDYTTQPSAQAFNNALANRVYQYGRLNPKNIASIKAQLAVGNAVYWAMPVDSNFQSQGPKQPWKGPLQPGAGGHAMALAGYDDALNAFMIRNSWGSTWGTSGYGYIDYNAFAQYAQEAFVVKVADFTNPNLPNPLPTPSLAGTSFDSANNGPAGLGFLMGGTVGVPPIAGVSAMIGVLVYGTNPDGSVAAQVPSTDPVYNDGAGNLATGSPPMAIGSGLQANWTAYLPYTTLGVQPGQTNTYVAFPALFVDELSILTVNGNVFTVTNTGTGLTSMARYRVVKGTRTIPAPAALTKLRRQMHFTSATGSMIRR